MRVTSLQLEIKDRPKEETLRHVLDFLDLAQGSNLILLPEMWPCGYFSFARYEADSEPLDGLTVRALAQKASELNAYILTGSFPERDGADLFNTSVLLDAQGAIVARYRKIHLFGHQSAEQRLLRRGHDVTVVGTPWGQAGLSTCYDLRFPELYREMVDRGAAFFLVSSAWPAPRLEAWTLFNRARAHENLAYLFSCNCAGLQGGQQYGGHSLFVDPTGKVLAEGDEGECLVSAEIDMGLVERVRRDFPALEDRTNLDDGTALPKRINGDVFPAFHDPTTIER